MFSMKNVAQDTGATESSMNPPKIRWRDYSFPISVLKVTCLLQYKRTNSEQFTTHAPFWISAVSVIPLARHKQDYEIQDSEQIILKNNNIRLRTREVHWNERNLYFWSFSTLLQCSAATEEYFPFWDVWIVSLLSWQAHLKLMISL